MEKVWRRHTFVEWWQARCENRTLLLPDAVVQPRGGDSAVPAAAEPGGGVAEVDRIGKRGAGGASASIEEAR